MELDDLNYELPKERIAFIPEKRGKARLLICSKEDGSFKEDIFFNIEKYIPLNSLIILNNTKVFKARVFFNFKDGKKGELLVLKDSGKEINCLIKPMKKFIKEKKIFFKSGISGEFKGFDEKGRVFLSLSSNSKELIEKEGHVPLPPYIKRGILKKDEKWYQTVYAKKIGSVAAPTAGFHFTKEIIKKLKEKGIEFAFITLHIGEGTFKPIRTSKIEDHKMEEEWFEISKKNAYKIEKAKKEGRKIIAVGTSTARTIESAFLKNNGKIRPIKDKTDLFIYPGFKFNVTDCLITNFHLPKSTPLALVCSFAGIENIKKWYKEAIDRGFRFLSYGDSMLII